MKLFEVESLTLVQSFQIQPIMSSSVVHSPLLNLSIIDRMLHSSAEMPMKEKLALLSARTHLLQKAGNSKTEELRSRLQLAMIHHSMVPPDLISAESELSLIEAEAKRMLKRESPDTTEILRIRIQGLKALTKVERDLGRVGRAKRWEDLVQKLELETVT